MMGQNLSEPVTEKSSADGGDERLIYGVASMQGWRFSMEDSHSAVLDLQPSKQNGEQSKNAKNISKLSFFGVYDGHGGDKVAQYAGENVHLIVARQEAFKNGNIEQALKDGFLATDRAILNDSKFENEASGCTATVGIVSDTKIFVANAGDSRSVLGVKGRAKPLSFDHKPMNEGEKARIISAGGTVEQGRVNGNLALSRAIGDFDFKKSASLAPEQQAVTVYPDVTIHDISNDDEFMVIACDGIWDCRSSQAVIEFIRRGIAAKQELSKICENLMDNCLSPESEPGGIGCDNMTLVIIGLLHGKSKEEWYEEIGRRVSDGDGPCAPPEYAELRGPSVNKNFVDSDNLEEPSKGDSGHFRRIILLSDGSDSLTNSDDTVLFDISDDDLEFSNQVTKIPDSESSEAFQSDGSRIFRREELHDSHVDDVHDADETDNTNDTDDLGEFLPTDSSRRSQDRLFGPKAADASDASEPQEREFFSASGYQRFRPKSPDSNAEEESNETDNYSKSRKEAHAIVGIQKFQIENSRLNKSNETYDLKKSKDEGGLQRFESKSPDQYGLPPITGKRKLSHSQTSLMEKMPTVDQLQPSSRDASGEEGESTAAESNGIKYKKGSPTDVGKHPAKRLRSSTREKAIKAPEFIQDPIELSDTTEDSTNIVDRIARKGRKNISKEDEKISLSMAPPPIGKLIHPVGYTTNPPPAGKTVRVYADGVFDLFHLGHMRQLEQAKKAFPDVHLIVGVTGDKETHKRKGLTVLSGQERAETVRHCKWVDEVIEDCPWIATPSFLDENRIDYVAHDDLPYVADEGNDIYEPIKAAGKFLVTQRTEGVSTTGIITKIVRDYDKYITRQFKRGTSRQELNVSWLKKNELDLKRHVSEMRDAIRSNWSTTGQELGKELRQFWQASRPGSPGAAISHEGPSKSNSIASPSTMSLPNRRLDSQNSEGTGPGSDFATGYSLGLIGGVRSWMTRSRQTSYDSPQGSDSSEEDIDDCSPSRTKV